MKFGIVEVKTVCDLSSVTTEGGGVGSKSIVKSKHAPHCSDISDNESGLVTSTSYSACHALSDSTASQGVVGPEHCEPSETEQKSVFYSEMRITSRYDSA